jgi:hypothetical protein
MSLQIIHEQDSSMLLVKYLSLMLLTFAKDTDLVVVTPSNTLEPSVQYAALHILTSMLVELMSSYNSTFYALHFSYITDGFTLFC